MIKPHWPSIWRIKWHGRVLRINNESSELSHWLVPQSYSAASKKSHIFPVLALKKNRPKLRLSLVSYILILSSTIAKFPSIPIFFCSLIVKYRLGRIMSHETTVTKKCVPFLPNVLFCVRGRSSQMVSSSQQKWNNAPPLQHPPYSTQCDAELTALTWTHSHHHPPIPCKD